MTLPISQCVYCKHLKRDWTCDAFLEGIPRDIADSEVDHREPYKGDNDVRFEPIDDDAERIVDQLFEAPTKGNES